MHPKIAQTIQLWFKIDTVAIWSIVWGRSKISWRRGVGGRVKPRRQVSVRERVGGFAKSVSWHSTYNFEQSTHGFFFFFKLQSINKNETKTPDLKTIHGIRYKSRTAVQGDVTVLNIARSKQEESGCRPHSGPLIGWYFKTGILRMQHLQENTHLLCSNSKLLFKKSISIDMTPWRVRVGWEGLEQRVRVESG